MSRIVRAIAVAGLASAALPCFAVPMAAVTSANQLVFFDSAAPATITRTVAITGLQAGESLLGLDVRPATGQLYALGSSSRLYFINNSSGQAVQIGAGQFTTPLNGGNFGFDFNPVVDRIRVNSDAEQNMRLHPDTGAIAGVDTNLNPPGDVVAAAYDRNFAGTTLTTLYAIDSGTDQLVRQGGVDGTPSPNGGLITPIGPLNFDSTAAIGFDISATTGQAVAVLTVSGLAQLFSINLASGAATPLGQVGGGSTLVGLTFVEGLATPTNVPTLDTWSRLGLLLMLSAVGAWVLRRRSWATLR